MYPNQREPRIIYWWGLSLPQQQLQELLQVDRRQGLRGDACIGCVVPHSWPGNEVIIRLHRKAVAAIGQHAKQPEKRESRGPAGASGWASRARLSRETLRN
jgi:hypothetical protein